jgi:hypothetical protein
MIEYSAGTNGLDGIEMEGNFVAMTYLLNFSNGDKAIRDLVSY